MKHAALMAFMTVSMTAAALQPMDAGERLWNEANFELAQMKLSKYQHDSEVDRARGIFNYDCSGFIIEALGQASPSALAALKAATVSRPLAKHFVKFFAAQPADGRPWKRVASVRELKRGDIIAWLKPDDLDSRNTGHIVIVDGPLTVRPGTDEVEVPIIDATAAPHGKQDARKAAGRTGLGKGSIVLLTDGSGTPLGYRWSLWEKSPRYPTTVVMARLQD